MNVPTEFSPPVRTWFADTFGDPTPSAGPGMAGHPTRRAHADSCSHRIGQDPDRVPVGIDDLFRELTGTVATDAADEHSSNGRAEGGGAWSCLPVLAYAADSLAHKESAVVETTTPHGR